LKRVEVFEARRGEAASSVGCFAPPAALAMLAAPASSRLPRR
jgi:hypothetical protein